MQLLPPPGWTKEPYDFGVLPRASGGYDRAVPERNTCAIFVLAALFFGPSDTCRASVPLLRYRVHVGAELAEVELVLPSGARRLVPGDDGAGLGIHAVTPSQGRAVPDDGGFLLSGVGRGATVRYRVSLERAAATSFGGRLDDGVILPADALLLRPARLAEDGAEVTITSAAGVFVSAPWLRSGDHFVLDHDALVEGGWIAVGGRPPVLRTTGKTRLEIAVVGAGARAERLVRWVEEAARAVATVSGGAFPTARAQVVVAALPGQKRPVFGECQRAGGPSVLLLVGRDTDDATLAEDWMAPHELFHVGVPRIYPRTPWLAEGLATYFAAVARARAGKIDRPRLWHMLMAGAKDADGDGSLGEASATLGRHHDYDRVYWGGASVALLIDLALRRAGVHGGLPARLTALRRATHDAMDVVTAERVLAALDGGTGVLGPIVARYVAGRVSPRVALDALWPALGVLDDGERARLDDRAPLAPLRRAIDGQQP